MRRILCLFVLIVLVSSLSACKRQNPDPDQNVVYFSGREQEEVAGLNTQAPNNGSSRLLTFSSENEAQSLAKKGENVVYFFITPSCVTCQSAQKDLEKRLTTFSTKVIVIIVDYEKEKAMKEKYKPSHEHTWVQIDGEGKVITKWQGGTTDELVNNVQ